MIKKKTFNPTQRYSNLITYDGKNTKVFEQEVLEGAEKIQFKIDEINSLKLNDKKYLYESYQRR